MMKHVLHFLFAATIFVAGNTVIAQSTNITGPAGSGLFGSTVTVLTNGNYVVTDPGYDEGAIVNVGAVHLYNGSTHALISTLKGSTASDVVGNGGIIALSNGNYVIRSQNWDNGAATNAGAVTWCNGTTGVNGIVNSSNSLVGSTTNDNVGNNGTIVLSNGNYVVRSTVWNNGAIIIAGAITWCNGTTGRNGVVSSINSLVGSKANDNVGGGGITILSNGNYVVNSNAWDNAAVINAGAVTFGNGTSGITGVVSSSNSLVGSTANNVVGSGGIVALSNGNYVVNSTNWDNGAATDAGAATFGNGTTGITGVVSSSNSLVGSTANNLVGSYGITVLSNSNYVVNSANWDNGAAADAGAVTFCNGTTGRSGVVSSINSLVGGLANSLVGNGGVTALNNGNYVVLSRAWYNGAVTNAGAVTFGNGTVGVNGIVSNLNSLVGSAANDNVGYNGVTALGNSNYVVSSPFWTNGVIPGAGAVTFGNGTTGISGAVSSINSLVGSMANDQVGFGAIKILTNSNYVVNSYYWDNGAATDAGAVTFGNGTTGITGLVSNSNSLVGSTTNDYVGKNGITALNNGNFVVISSEWHNGAITEAGAVTFGNGSTGISGVVSSFNSLVGGTVANFVGYGGVTALSNGNYVVMSYAWDNGVATNAGAATFGSGTVGISGVVSSSNSLVGSTANDQVGYGGGGIVALSNGNYVVSSPHWNNSGAIDAGAVTFGDGTTGINGVITSSNSLVGNAANNLIGFYGIKTLNNGNYVVHSPNWDNGAVTDAGAVTFGSGTTGINGVVSNSNSLVGSTINDNVGNTNISILSNSSYVVQTENWDNGASANAGAITLGNGSGGVYGTITSCKSVPGTTANGGANLVFAYNPTYDYLIVGRPSDNIVTIYNASGMSLANSLDAVTVNINGTNAVPLIASTGCRIIATLTANGASPVNGTINAKVWIEPTVPIFAGKPFVAKHFEITPVANASTATGRVTIYCTQQEFDDFNADPASINDLPAYPNDVLGKYNLKIGKYSGSSSNGSGLPGTYTGPNQVINPDDNDIVWNSLLNRWEVSFNVTGFSGFIIQSNSFLLPLLLLSFNGFLQNNNGLLHWKTTNELNTHSFDIERSIDGRTYTKVGNVAAYNTPGDHQYNFTDNNINLLAAPVVYYRLKQKDIDGWFTYSSIVALSIDGSKIIVLFYPNPVTTEANLSITVNKSQQVQGRIIDNAGRIIKQLQWNVLAGSTAFPVDVKALASGMYWLELIGATINERKVFVKQ